jgi:hypothetical protein
MSTRGFGYGEVVTLIFYATVVTVYSLLFIVLMVQLPSSTGSRYYDFSSLAWPSRWLWPEAAMGRVPGDRP